MQHLECRNRVGSFSKKKRPTGRDSQCRTTRPTYTDCSTGSGSTHCQQFGGGLPLTASVGDYQAVTIPEGSVIYCDIPYKDTNVYDTTNGFDYDRFYEWCARQTQPLFISSYEMPADRFRCIEEFTHRSTLSASANNEVTERIFIPMHQQPPARPVQLSLF